MKFLGLMFLVAFALGDKTHYFHQEGKMSVNHEEGKIVGVSIVEFLNAINMTHIGGMFTQAGSHIPFELSSKISIITYNPDGSFVINLTCFEGWYGKKVVKKLYGTGLITGTWNQIRYIGNYRSDTDHLLFEFDVIGKNHLCQYYSMDEAALRAADLLDDPYTTYKGNELLNHAVYGYAYLSTTCMDYLRDVGKVTTKEKPGALIIANDGTYCAIVDREVRMFFHSSPTKRKVVKTPMYMIGYIFESGYTMKEYDCNQ